jgi:hypothetical protein
MMLEASKKALESHGFKTDHWCAFAGAKEREGMHIQNMS